MKIMSCVILVAGVATFACLPARADVSAADKTFVTKAAQAGFAEVQLGQLAADKGGSQDVKDFGSHMVTDHSKNNDELKALADSKTVPLPPAKLDAKHQAAFDKLSKLSGDAFDKEYIKDMVDGHKKVDALMTKEASGGQDADLKAFAAKTDETVKMHLSMAEDIQKKLK